MKRSPLLLIILFVLLGPLNNSCQSGAASPDDTITSVRPSGSEFHQLTTYFHQKTDRGELAGTVILLKQKNEIWMDKYGYQNREEEIPISYETIFRLASMTKPITSTAVLMLVEQNKLQLEQPVSDFLPAFAQVSVLRNDGTIESLGQPVSIKDLLLHTSGLSNNLFQNTAAEKAYVEAFQNEQPTSLAELVDILTTLPLAHQPGESWTYSFSTDVLGRIVEIVSGQALDEFFQKHIFTPLGMDDTGFQVPPEKRDRFAAAYARELRLIDAPNETSRYCNGKNYARGNGGLCSTARDYLRFCQMLLNGGELEGVRILQSETVRSMMQNHLPEGVLPHTPGMPALCNGFGLGFGIQTKEVIMGHEGDVAWPGAYLTYFFIDPNHQGIGVLMAQNTDFSNLPMLKEFHQQAGQLFAANYPDLADKNHSDE